MLGGRVLFLQAGRPRYPAIWVFAGYASFLAVLFSTDTVTIADNLFVGAQLIVLLGFGVFALTYEISIDPKFVQRLSVSFLIGQSLSSLVALSAELGYSFLGSEKSWYHRAQGLAAHPNIFGLMSCVAVLVALQLAFTSRKYRLFALAAVVVNTVGLVGSGSLTAILGLPIGLMVLVLCMREHLGKLVVRSIGFAFAILLLAVVTGVFRYVPWLSQRYVQATEISAGVHTWEMRTLTYEFAWNTIVENPVFGRGINVEAVGTHDGTTAVHNAILRAWYQGGALLALAFALIIVATLITVLRAIIEKKHGSEASLLVIFVLLSASVTPVLEQRHFWLPVIVAWASISAADAQREPNENYMKKFDRWGLNGPSWRHRAASD